MSSWSRMVRIGVWVAVFVLGVTIPFQTRIIFGWVPIEGGFNEWAGFFLYGTDFIALVVIGLGLLWMFRVKHCVFDDVSRETFFCFWKWFGLSKRRSAVNFVSAVRRGNDVSRGILNSEGDVSRETLVGGSRFGQMFHVKHWLSSCALWYLLLGLFLVAAGLSVFYGFNFDVAAFRFVKLLEFILLGFVLSLVLDSRGWVVLLGGVVLGGAIQSVIAILQFVFQRSLGFSILGESVLGADIGGVAKVFDGAEKLIRAYGTFPHPNVLGAFLVAAILFAIYLIFRFRNRIAVGLSLAAVAVMGFGIVLTFSRSAWLALGVSIFVLVLFSFWRMFHVKHWVASDVSRVSGGDEVDVSRETLVGGSGFWSMFHVKHWLVILAFVAGILVPVLVFSGPVLGRVEAGEDYVASDAARGEIADFAGTIIHARWNSGVGIGNFVLAIDQYVRDDLLSWEYQPAHNLFLLVWAELGIVGFALLVLFFASLGFGLVRRFVLRPGRFGAISCSIFSGMVVLSFFDHYFWTLQQGQLLFWIVVGLTMSYLMFHVKH